MDFDRGLYNAVKRLRDALGDSADRPRYIETVSKRGYRVIAGVHRNGDDTIISTDVIPSLKVSKTRGSSRNRNTMVGVAITFLIATALALTSVKLWFSGKGADRQIKSIAVLPLQNLSAAFIEIANVSSVVFVDIGRVVCNSDVLAHI